METNKSNKIQKIKSIGKIKLYEINCVTKRKMRSHIWKVKSKDNIVKEMYEGWIKFNIIMEAKLPSGSVYKYNTSVSLKKNIVTLWLVMMDKIHTDHNKVIIDFIQNVCLKRWRGDTGKGFGDFVLKCMIHSMMEEDDWEKYKMVYKSLNMRNSHHKKAIPTEKGNGHIKGEREISAKSIKRVPLKNRRKK